MVRYAALVALVLVGCSPDSGTSPEPEPDPVAPINPVGTYVLAQLDGRTLPADLNQRTPGDCASTGDFCVTNGTLVLEPGGRYTLTFEWIRYRGGLVNQTGSRNDFGAYVLRDSSLAFTSGIRADANGNPLRYVGRGRTNQVDVTDGNTFGFRK